MNLAGSQPDVDLVDLHASVFPPEIRSTKSDVPVVGISGGFFFFFPPPSLILRVCVFSQESQVRPSTTYSLHQPQGNKEHGTERSGYLYKKSDG